MRLVSFRRNETTEAGIASDDSVLPLRPLGYGSAIDFIAAKTEARAQAERAWAAGTGRISLGGVRLAAPIPRPPKILCVGLNYRDHATESKMEIPPVPTIFSKFSSAVVGPDEPVIVPGCTSKPDYEGEFAVVIGRTSRRVRASEWRDHVLGYTILNDVSARDIQFATTQWSLAKSLDTFCPIGPHIVTADEVPEPRGLDIRLSIGGEVLQHSNTRELIFGVPELIEYLSSLVTLEPGDIISTGTPAGVGLGRTPPRWLRDGEEMVVEIERIGTLRNPVMREGVHRTLHDTVKHTVEGAS